MRDRTRQRALGPHSCRLEHSPPLCRRSPIVRYWQYLLEPLAIREDERVAPYRERHLDYAAAGIDADRGARPARIGRSSLRLLYLKELQPNPPRIIGRAFSDVE
jgi:hypothetical protein